MRATSKDWIEHLLSSYQLDLFVGSVHHVHGIPIDFTPDCYAKALASSGARKTSAVLSAETKLFMDYFDAQLALVTALRPPIVGHFDLIRLLSSDPNRNLQSSPTVWEKIERNLTAIQSYGGALELNSSGLRKGLKEPYPKLEVCRVRPPQTFASMVLSHDRNSETLGADLFSLMIAMGLNKLVIATLVFYFMQKRQVLRALPSFEEVSRR